MVSKKILLLIVGAIFIFFAVSNYFGYKAVKSTYEKDLSQREKNFRELQRENDSLLSLEQRLREREDSIAFYYSFLLDSIKQDYENTVSDFDILSNDDHVKLLSEELSKND